MSTVKNPRICVLNCRTNKPLHAFPKDEIGRSVWLKQLSLKQAPDKAFVCDNHFSAQMKPTEKSIKLTPWAIPDINLPESFSDDTDSDFGDEEVFMNDDEPTNGYSKVDSDEEQIDMDSEKEADDVLVENDKPMDDTIESDPLDFDDILAKKHCISDIKNNNGDKAVSTEDGDPDSADYDEDLEMRFDDEDLTATNSAALENEQEYSDEGTVSAPPSPVEITTKFKRKLIASVRKRRILYDPAHPCFGDIEKKSQAWERIGKIQKLNGTACRELWLNMRYEYQDHVRSLRRWLSGEYSKRERPRVQFENDMIFLWRYIADKSFSEDIDEIEYQPNSVACHIQGIEDKLKDSEDVRTVDHPYANKKTDESVEFACNLIETVQYYPELYNRMHPNFGDLKRRSVIWDAIGNELKENPTKCLSTWIQLQLRYEFEIKHNKSSYLVNKMAFLFKHIIENDKSPYKRATLLTREWVEPFNTSEDQHQLLAAIVADKRTRPYLANIEELVPSGTENKIIPCWLGISRKRKCPPEQCEVTWLIMQTLYLELLEYRRHDCELRDEWEFESIITNLRETVTKTKVRKTPKTIPAILENPCYKSNKPIAPANSTNPNAAVSNIVVSNTAVNNTAVNNTAVSNTAVSNTAVSNAAVSNATLSSNAVSTTKSFNIAGGIKHNRDIRIQSNSASNENDIDMRSLDIEDISPPKTSTSEITFTIPGKEAGDPDEFVRYQLDTPISDLPEKSVVDINSVLENAHIVVFSGLKIAPAVYLFTLEKRRELIGEVMARPILFNPPCKFSRLSRIFWGEVSTDVKYPAEVCMKFWEYIEEKEFFVDYHPSWKKTPDQKWIAAPYPIFEKFQKYTVSRNWAEYSSILPEFLQEISNFPLIYVEIKFNSSWNRRQCHARDISEVWTILARKFAVLDGHKVIWEKFKNIFLLYMSEMELSMYNAWPPFWAPTLSKLKFLYELKYSPKTPIYHVLKYKIDEEIQICEEFENSSSMLSLGKLDAVTNAKAIFRLLKENEYLEDFTWVNRARFVSKIKSFPMLYDISHPLFGNKEAKLDAWQEIALLFHCTVGECHLIFQHLMKSFLIFRARDPHQICRVNAKYWENMTYIYSCAVPNAIDPKSITGRSFRSNSNGSTIKLAEEYQAEISLVDAKPRLLLKNLASAVNSLPIQIQSPVTQHIKLILSQYKQILAEEIVVDV